MLRSSFCICISILLEKMGRTWARGNINELSVLLQFLTPICCVAESEGSHSRMCTKACMGFMQILFVLCWHGSSFQLKPFYFSKRDLCGNAKSSCAVWSSGVNEPGWASGRGIIRLYLDLEIHIRPKPGTRLLSACTWAWPASNMSGLVPPI